MTLSKFVPSIGSNIRAAILSELKEVEIEHDVKIVFAVESGSRAWGFPSPDSDYDVRFIYAHRTEWYLSIEPGRDVIERPISDELDVGGWDIKKALGLLVKPNPVMFEWLSSPIRYIWNEPLCVRLTEFSQKPAHSTACLYHYLNLGAKQYERHLDSKQKVKLKTYFYVLRPALAIRWMRLNKHLVPPMNLQALAVQLDLEHDVLDALEDLIIRKSKMKESETTNKISPLDALIRSEFAWGRSALKEKDKRDLMGEADELFREILRVCDER